MNNRRFQLDFEFASRGPTDVAKVIEVEGVLRRELLVGEIQGHQVGTGQAILSITTEEPADCFDQTLRLLKALELVPRATRFAAIVPFPSPSVTLN